MFDDSLLIILGISTTVGIFSGLWGLLLDFLLDYGHVFGFMRLNKAKSILTRGADLEVLHSLEEIRIGIDPWSDRLNKAAEIYDRIAGNYPGFRLWVCPYCIALRIATISIPITVILEVVLLGFNQEDLFLSIILGIMVIPTVCFLTVKKLDQ